MLPDWIVTVSAWFELFCFVLLFVAYPFLIGTYRDPNEKYTAGRYLIKIALNLTALILAGRALGWW